MSPRIVVAAVAVFGALAVTAGVAAHANTNAESSQAEKAAKKILRAADTYAVSSAQAGCPTITELIEADKLDDAARTEDAWGNRFRIVCEGTGARVVSAGPDGRLGTSDDLRYGH